MRTPNFLLPLIAALILCTMGALAQRTGERPVHGADRDLVRVGDMLYAEAVVLPPDSDSVPRVDVIVRVTWDFIVFTRTTSAHPDSSYSGSVELSIDIRPQTGGGGASSTDRVRVFTGDYESTNARDRYVLMHRSFSLQPGEYTVLVEASDGGSTRTRAIPLPVRIKPPDTPAPLLFSAVPIESIPSDTTMPLQVRAFGGSVPFAHPATFLVCARASADATWDVTLSRLREDEAPERVMLIHPVPAAVRRAPVLDRSTGAVTSVRAATTGSGDVHSFIFTLPFDTVDAGTYAMRLVLHDAGGADTLNIPCRVLWQDMPLSLRELQFATSVMRYILSEDEIDSLNSGGDAAREQWMRAWWKRNDPTPLTPYNERMAEYFRRVDQAYFRFQTLASPNGALTDRGKIFILYGEPEDVERSLEPGSVAQEIWKYPSLKKTFRFTDRNRNGNLRLVP